MECSIIIPTLNAGKRFRRLLERIVAQQFDSPLEIIVMDSGSKDGTVEAAREFEQVRLFEITDFTHGRSRNAGAKAADGKFLVFMTQDALPTNENWLANLLKPFSDEKVAAAFSRQVPWPEANPMERHFLARNFSDKRVVRRLNGKRKPGLFDVFFSNVSSAIRRDIWQRFSFDEQIIMSEDQKFAREVLCAGYKTVYEPMSVVYHSHDYNLRTVFQRYFDSLYSLDEIFEQSIDDVFKPGTGYIISELSYIWRHHRRWLPYYFVYNLYKVGGTLAGKYARLLPRKLCRKLSMHKYYWKDDVDERL